MNTELKIGFIGYGEAAYNISAGLREEGIQGIRATDTMQDDPVVGRQIHERAAKVQVELVPNAVELAKWADILFAAVPSSFTLDVCASIQSVLRPGQLYVDVSASTPSTKEKIWAAIQPTGVLFVDAAMLGSLPQKRHKVPITASGNGAAALKERMEPYGMCITLAGERAGAASAIKLVRSIFMKGIAALMIEMLEAAETYGVSQEVIQSVAESMDSTPFVPTMERLVKGTAIHCARRAAELKGSGQMLEEAGLSDRMTRAAKKAHEALVPFDFARRNVEEPLKGWQDVIEPILSEKE